MLKYYLAYLVCTLTLAAACESSAPGTELTPAEGTTIAPTHTRSNPCEADPSWCTYVAADLDNAVVRSGGEVLYDAAAAQWAVVVASPPETPYRIDIQVEQALDGVLVPVLDDSSGKPLPSELSPGEARALLLPRRDVDGTTLAPLAYRITSSAPILAYQLNPFGNEEAVYSSGSTLLLPEALLGTDYRVMTRKQSFADLRGFVTVINTADLPTEVSVTVTAPTLAGVAHPDDPARAHPIPAMKAGTTRSWTLGPLDVLNIESDWPGADLTGTRVVADRRVAVFGGSEAANAPDTADCIEVDPASGQGVCAWDETTPCATLLDCVDGRFATCCADHLEQQLPPVADWGVWYLAARSVARGQARDLVRILAAVDDTHVTIEPPLPGVTMPVLAAGQHFEFELDADAEIQTSPFTPILVGHFLVGSHAPSPNVDGSYSPEDANIGDPDFRLLLPVERYRNDFALLVPDGYRNNYLEVIAPIGSQVVVDDVALPPSAFEPIGRSAWAVARRETSAGVHTVLCTEPASVGIYGWDSYVSYAHSGGETLGARYE